MSTCVRQRPHRKNRPTASIGSPSIGPSSSRQEGGIHGTITLHTCSARCGARHRASLAVYYGVVPVLFGNVIFTACCTVLSSPGQGKLQISRVRNSGISNACSARNRHSAVAAAISKTDKKNKIPGQNKHIKTRRNNLAEIPRLAFAARFTRFLKTAHRHSKTENLRDLKLAFSNGILRPCECWKKMVSVAKELSGKAWKRRGAYLIVFYLGCLPMTRHKSSMELVVNGWISAKIGQMLVVCRWPSRIDS